jgi:hypothetical protein
VSAWSTSPLPAVLVPDALPASRLAEVREALARAPSHRDTRIDRASWDELWLEDAALRSALELELVARASAVTGRRLALFATRFVRLGPGDYALTRADQVHEGHPVEVVLDVSRAHVPGAEVHYRHRGQLFFVVPSAPGALAVVERGPTVLANHTYVSKRLPDAEVLRVIALL